jgi:hypothetical protein
MSYANYVCNLEKAIIEGISQIIQDYKLQALQLIMSY